MTSKGSLCAFISLAIVKARIASSGERPMVVRYLEEYKATWPRIMPVEHGLISLPQSADVVAILRLFSVT